jgi:hypothetical protein
MGNTEMDGMERRSQAGTLKICLSALDEEGFPASYGGAIMQAKDEII